MGRLKNQKNTTIFRLPKWWYFLIILAIIILFQGFEKHYSFNGSYLSSTTIWIGVVNVFYMKPYTTAFWVIFGFGLFYGAVVFKRFLKIWWRKLDKK